MKKILKDVWEWLDGNKMIIGLTLGYFANWAEGNGMIEEASYQLFTSFAGLLTGGGLVHKLIKGKNNTGK